MGVEDERGEEEMLESDDVDTFSRYMWWMLHRHTPTTYITYFNNAVVTIAYCSGCHQELYRTIEDSPLTEKEFHDIMK
jgi:hypothetical protein